MLIDQSLVDAHIDHGHTRMDGANAVLAIIERDGWGLAGILTHIEEIRDEVERGGPFCVEASDRPSTIERIAGMCGLPRSSADEPALAWLERAVRWNAEQRLRPEQSSDSGSQRSDARRKRIFTFANGSEIDVDRYLGMDATATARIDNGVRPAITFQLGHGGFLRVAFESEQQRVDELARLRAFRDGAA